MDVQVRLRGTEIKAKWARRLVWKNCKDGSRLEIKKKKLNNMVIIKQLPSMEGETNSQGF